MIDREIACARMQRVGAKILPLRDLEKEAARLRAEGRRLVLTNGCFDLLHLGHVRYLRQAAQLGDALIVAINGDASVRALKGKGRPLNSAEDRAEVVAALECVTFVTIFPQLRATEVIESLRPEVYVKGGDYSLETLNFEEKNALTKVGAEIRTLPLVPGQSTSHLIERMCQA